MVAYGEFRASYEKDPVDSRIVLYGLRYLIENYVAAKWTVEDVENAAIFFNSHMSSSTPDVPESCKYPFPKDLFLQVCSVILSIFFGFNFFYLVYSRI